jgi:hypothetical protein
MANTESQAQSPIGLKPPPQQQPLERVAHPQTDEHIIIFCPPERD